MRSGIGIGLTLSVLVCFSAMPSRASSNSICDSISGNLVLNCGFEATPIVGDGFVPTDWTGQQFTAFEEVQDSTVNSGTESLRFANDQNPDQPFDGAALLSQNFTDIPGEEYALQFYVLNGDPGGNNELLQAFWGTQASPTSGKPLLADSGASDSSSTFALHAFTVTGTGSDTLTFTAYNNPNFFYLDDISLVDTGINVATTTPEPATVGLAIAALAGFGLIRRRTKP